MYFVSQNGRKVLPDEQLVAGRTNRDAETGEWKTGWDVDTGDDFKFVPMATYHTKEDAELVDALRKWAEYTAKLSTFHYPSADEAAELRERITELLAK